jgi:integrase
VCLAAWSLKGGTPSFSVLLDRGIDLSTAADLAGHASPNTTKRYDRRGERDRDAAAEAIVVPYVMPTE